MSSANIDTFRNTLTTHLDWFAARNLSVSFWWRDDDAVEPTAALDLLIGLSNAYDVELALAVIPNKATNALAKRVADEPNVVVLQHGFCHRNFQFREIEERSAEFGTRRNPDEAIADLSIGAAQLHDLFGEKFLPVLVPPWNRIAPAIASRICQAGLFGLSTFTSRYPYQRRQLQTHIDIINWQHGRCFIGWRYVTCCFDLQLARRRTNAAEPIGVLTHHLVHDHASFDFLNGFLEVARSHPGACFPKIADLVHSCTTTS